MDLDLKGKSVVITGGGSNIGRAIVLGFAAEGANITIGDIDEKQAGDTAELAKRAGAGRVQVVKTDVTDLAQVQAMFRSAAKAVDAAGASGSGSCCAAAVEQGKPAAPAGAVMGYPVGC